MYIYANKYTSLRASFIASVGYGKVCYQFIEIIIRTQQHLLKQNKI